MSSCSLFLWVRSSCLRFRSHSSCLCLSSSRFAASRRSRSRRRSSSRWRSSSRCFSSCFSSSSCRLRSCSWRSRSLRSCSWRSSCARRSCSLRCCSRSACLRFSSSRLPRSKFSRFLSSKVTAGRTDERRGVTLPETLHNAWGERDPESLLLGPRPAGLGGHSWLEGLRAHMGCPVHARAQPPGGNVQDKCLHPPTNSLTP